MSNKIEIVTTCVGRSSFLRETLPLNKPKVDNIIVVTTPTDYETQRICNGEGATCIQTDSFYMHNAPFDKGRAMNKGLGSLLHHDWVIFIDCDVLLLPTHVNFFKDKSLNKDCLYGCRRIILETRQKYQDFIKTVALNPQTFDVNKYINDDPKELGVGFFQFFNMSSSVIKDVINKELLFDDETFKNLVMPIVNDVDYPRCFKKKGEIHPLFPHAGGSDSQFRHFFSERNLMNVVNIPVIHLGSIGSGHGGVGRNFE